VEAELKKRGLNPVADHDPANKFESFHVIDPGGFDVQISNGSRKTRRLKPAAGKTAAPPPFEATGGRPSGSTTFRSSARTTRHPSRSIRR
jgi:hypothetical protein